MMTPEVRSPTSPTHPRPQRLATFLVSQRLRERRQKRNQNGMLRLPPRGTDHLPRIVLQTKLHQKCCETMLSCAACTLPTLSRFCSRRRRNARWPSLRRAESTRAQSSPLTRKRESATLPTQATCHTFTRTLQCELPRMLLITVVAFI